MKKVLAILFAVSLCISSLYTFPCKEHGIRNIIDPLSRPI